MYCATRGERAPLLLQGVDVSMKIKLKKVWLKHMVATVGGIATRSSEMVAKTEGSNA
jgi:hypothetical protein